MITIPKAEQERLATKRGTDERVRFGSDEYHWLEPAQSAQMRAALDAMAKPPEGRTKADSLLALVGLLRDFGIGDVSGPIRKFGMDAACEGNLLLFSNEVLEGGGESLVVRFVPEASFVARFARTEKQVIGAEALMRIVQRYGEKVAPGLWDYTYRGDAQRGKTHRIEAKIPALRFVDKPEVARLMAEGGRHGYPGSEEWIVTHPELAARGLVQPLMDLAWGLGCLVNAGHRDVILKAASAYSTLSEVEQARLERLLDAAAAADAKAPARLPRVADGLFGANLEKLASERFDVGARAAVRTDAELSAHDRTMVRTALGPVASLHLESFTTLEALLEETQEDCIFVQPLTDRETRATYTIVVHSIGDNADGFIMRDSDGVVVAEIIDGALSYKPSDWPGPDVSAAS
jgi:hypothetical protein